MLGVYLRRELVSCKGKLDVRFPLNLAMGVLVRFSEELEGICRFPVPNGTRIVALNLPIFTTQESQTAT
jgi:hypothetical protein